ncbi:LGFP repeat-containing protein [Actinoplanes regularis]|uniref:LGFP repeat-containing protein n=1 Tax=Actinoplanes regularis TaxID=52697 RepID=UPI0024A009E8|nr:hypothetical protein [Actinoplanes regularis]GLW34592.1 hypothetical protein Areg01_75290 [Actinoplanes regularis]
MKLRALTAVTFGLAAATLLGAASAQPAASEDKSATYCRIRVHGGILAKYIVLGSDKGRLGCPIGTEQMAAGGGGRVQQFDGATIYWSQATDAHPVSGRILDLFQKNRGELGCAGYPIDDESDTPDGRGRYQHFQHGTIWHWKNGKVSVVC